jgi:SAM-dependent methyltransferase
MSELLIGCGHKETWTKWLGMNKEKEWKDLTTLDINPNVGADVVHDLEEVPYPFPDNHFDEIHAYEVLEHLGRQGDWRSFFKHFSEFYRILKPSGLVLATVPHWQGVWAWSDPGHTRILTEATLIFLSQTEYLRQQGKTHMTDYREWWKGDFNLVYSVVEGEGYSFGLQAIKPSRINQ